METIVTYLGDLSKSIETCQLFKTQVTWLSASFEIAKDPKYR